MKVYAAWVNPCIYESANEVISLNRTKEGAEKALDEYKKKYPDFGKYRFEESGIDIMTVSK